MQPPPLELGRDGRRGAGDTLPDGLAGPWRGNLHPLMGRSSLNEDHLPLMGCSLDWRGLSVPNSLTPSSARQPYSTLFKTSLPN